MAEQKILISIKINDREAANTQKQLKVTKDNFNSLTEAEIKSIVADKQKALSAKAVDKALTQQAAAANAAAAATDNMRATSGLNNAIIMESSRLASDASFGFTAIANNLSQLVNLFQLNVRATGSFSSAIAGLFTAQAAFLIGIQLLITYGDRLFEVFMKLVGVSKVYRDALKDAGGEVQSLSGKFEVYVSTLQDVNSTQEEQKIAINGLKKEFPEYINQLKEADLTLADVANQTEEATKQNDLYKDSLLELAMSRAAMNSIEEASAEIISLRIEREAKMMDLGFKERVDANGKIITVEQQVRDELALLQSKYQFDFSKVSKQFRMDRLKELLSMNEEEIKEEESKIDKLVKLVDLENKKLKGAGKTRERDFKQQLLNLDKLEESYRQKSIDQTILTEDEKIDIEEKFAKKELEIRLNRFKERQKLRLDEFLESKASDSEKLQAQKDYNESIILAEQERNDVLIQLEESFDTKRDKLARKRAERSAEQYSKAFQEELRLIDEFNLERLKAEENYLKSYTDSEIDRVDAAKLVEQERFDAEIRRLNILKEVRLANGESAIDIDQKIANATAANSESNIALAEAERDAKIAIANQVGDAIVAVAGEGSTVGKAASIAMAIMNTREAFTAALGAKPYGPWNIAQAAATLAVGMAQVKKIIATKIPGKDPSASTSSTIEAPDFNVVGASQTSQLAEAVSTQQATPVRAFVVGKDISTQQELDRNITNTASFG